MVENHAAVARVRAELAKHGIEFTLKVFDEGTHTAVAAADALGIHVGQIASSIIFKRIIDGQASPLLVITSGQHRVDTQKVSTHLGLDTLHRADAEFVRQVSGFAIGGVAPIGWSEKPLTLIDVALMPYETIWAAAGHPHTVFSTTFEDLLHLTNAEPFDVGQR